MRTAFFRSLLGLLALGVWTGRSAHAATPPPAPAPAPTPAPAIPAPPAPSARPAPLPPPAPAPQPDGRDLDADLEHARDDLQRAVQHLQELTAERMRAVDANREQISAAVRQAEDQVRNSARRVKELTLNQVFVRNAPAPQLGINVSDAPDAGDGVTVRSVRTEGPAAKAGVQPGDVLLAINGKSLAPGRDGGRDDPFHRVHAITRELHAGDEVTLDYRRGNTKHRAKLALADPDDFNFNFAFGKPRFDFGAGPELPESWLDLELAPVNPELGQYFGTTTGVLVVKSPSAAGLPLKGGDVIQKIGDRAATSPEQVMRILRSYGAGEAFTLHVMRQKQATTLQAQVPGRSSADAAERKP